MKRTILSLVIVSALTGCASSHGPAAAPITSTAKVQKTKKSSLSGDRVKNAFNADTGAATAKLHAAGDFVVYRLTGSFHEQPVTLTQRVLKRDGNTMTLEVTIDEKGGSETLRLKMKIGAEGAEEIISVAKMTGDTAKPFGIAAYETRMSELMIAADENNGLIHNDAIEMNVGGKTIKCDKASYDVRVGAHAAVLHTWSTKDSVWGHIGGEITTKEGKVLYKAEVIDLGEGTKNDVALTEEGDDFYPDDI